VRPKARPIRSTLSDFRAFHLKELSELFLQVVKLAREMRLVAEAQVDRRADQRLDQERAGVSAIQHASLHRVKAEWKLVCLRWMPGQARHDNYALPRRLLV